MNEQSHDGTYSENVLFEVLENQTTLDSVRALLKQKGVPHSASSWSKMIEERIKPALSSRNLKKNELISLIREAEEHGRKHVRLFQYNPAKLADLRAAIQVASVSAWATRKGFPQLGTYIFEIYPIKPTVVEVRVGDYHDDSLVIKIARTEYRRKKSELVKIDGREVYLSDRVPFRAVDVLKIHSNGLVEARLTPRAEHPISYSGTANAMINEVKDLVDTFQMGELSLSRAKDTFSGLKKKAHQPAKFELYETQHKNMQGERIQSTSQSDQGGILKSDVMKEVIKNFAGSDPDAYCERVRVSYDFGNVKKINAILSEDVNEIIFTAGLNREEYDETLQGLDPLISGGQHDSRLENER